jgi:hypothetical protein
LHPFLREFLHLGAAGSGVTNHGGGQLRRLACDADPSLVAMLHTKLAVSHFVLLVGERQKIFFKGFWT